MRDGGTEIGANGASRFPQTHWDMIEDARASTSPTRLTSLERLAVIYWRPIYAYFRRKWGKSNDEAKDLTQEFFAVLCEKDFLRPDRALGRFRSYLMTVLDNFSRRTHRSTSRLQGTDPALLSLREETGFEVSADATAEEVFLREWAASVLNEGLRDMELAYRAEGRENDFRIFLLHDIERPAGDDLSYDALSRRFSIKLTDVTNILYRARQELRRRVLLRIQETVQTPEEAAAEMRELFGNRL